jgi:sn-glycerol 3-phosphate transport system ATP-binding protein
LSAISIEGVSKNWGEARAVDRISFAAAAGSLLVLLGPSGCGKSTTLRLVAGLEAADEGRISIAGRDVTALPPAERGIAMVFQSYALFPHLTVAENILFGLRVRKVPAAQRGARLARTAALLGLDGLLHRKPSQLSGGQQQRVALGRAIIAEAPLCLMDEPLSNLDAQLRHEMRREIRTLQQRLGMTMIYVTHDQGEAMSMADQVILLRNGRIEQDASPADLYVTPATAFAARFIGTPPMNLMRLADGPQGAVIAGSVGPALLAAPGDGLLLGVRPEDITLVAGGAADRLTVEGIIAAIEYLGADSTVSCTVGSEAITIRVPGRVALPVGAAVGLTWSPDAVHAFDVDSGRRRDDLLAALVTNMSRAAVTIGGRTDNGGE